MRKVDQEQATRGDEGSKQARLPVEQQKGIQHALRTFSGKLPFRRRVPEILQLSTVECGAACLAMILSYYGRKTSVMEIRERCGIGRGGASAHTLVKAAQSYNLRVRALSLQKSDFRYLPLPAIVHWNFNHFLVLERWTPRYVDVVDPAVGRSRMTQEEFDEGFTGVVLLLEPGVHFDRTPGVGQIKLRSYIANLARKAPGMLVQVLLASFLVQVLGLSVPALTKLMVDRVIPLQQQSVMVWMAAGILVLFLAQLVTTTLRALVLVYLQARVDIQMMVGFFEHLLQLPLRFFQQRSSGDIIARLNSNTVVRDTLSKQLISTILDGSMVTGYLFILFWQSPIFGVLGLGIGALQMLIFMLTRRRLHYLSSCELAAQGKTYGYAAETLTGIESLKAAGAEQQALQRWSNSFFQELNASIRRNLLSSVSEMVRSLTTTLAPLALLWTGTMLVLHGSMQVGTMLALNSLTVAFLTPLSSLMVSGQTIQLVYSHLERIADVMREKPEQDEQEVFLPSKLSGRVTLQHVSFRYDVASEDVLKDINLEIQPGQTVAIVGRTGSGKSTFGKLLLGLYQPTKGEILYDGIPLQRMNYQAVRAQFGAVMQDAVIFSGSVRQNISFNNPDMNMDQVVWAAHLAALHEDIVNLPMGYETPVAEGGSVLSGGQRQRLAIARALAHQPALLLLDEATSSLDVGTERRVARNISKLPCTKFIIAHRLSTVKDADIILVLERGRIMEYGTHNELLQRGGVYTRLIRHQLATGEIMEDTGRGMLGDQGGDTFREV